MIKKIAFAVLMLAAPLFAATAQNVENNQASAQQDDDAKYATELLKPGTEAPDFALATPDGKTVKLSDMRGKYVVLDFWASWCPDCRKDLPAIAALHNTYAERGVEFIGVSFDDKKENLVKAISDFNIAYTQVSELKKWKETQISAAYHIKWIPSMYLIAPDGKVVVSTVMKDKIAAKLAEIMPGCDEQSACCKKEAACCKQKTTCPKTTACNKATACDKATACNKATACDKAKACDKATTCNKAKACDKATACKKTTCCKKATTCKNK